MKFMQACLSASKHRESSVNYRREPVNKCWERSRRQFLEFLLSSSRPVKVIGRMKKALFTNAEVL